MGFIDTSKSRGKTVLYKNLLKYSISAENYTNCDKGLSTVWNSANYYTNDWLVKFSELKQIQCQTSSNINRLFELIK